MKWYFLFAIMATISSCCQLPLIDCGPKIEELKVSPENVKLATDKEIQIKAWQYYSRVDNEPSILHLDFELVKSDSVFIDKATIYIPETVQHGKINAELFASSIKKDLRTQSLSFQFPHCCKNYPLEIKLDSIPMILNSDTVYANLNIKITK